MIKNILITLFLIAAIPFIAFADDGSGSVWEPVLVFLKDPGTWAWVVMAALAGLKLWKRENGKKVEEALSTWVPVAYQAVNEIALLTPNSIDDKAALFLLKLSEMLKGDGIKVTGSVAAKAVALAKGLHFEDKVDNGVDPS